MKLKARIRTIKGKAEWTLNNLLPILKLSSRKVKYEGWVNKDDSELFMEMEGTPRMLKPVEQNIYKFQEKKKNITRTKLGKTMIRGLGGTNEQIEELKDLFDNDTEMTVIKEATAQELIDDTTTLWDYIKKSFRKVKKNE